MKKTTLRIPNKLSLGTETVRSLTAEDLRTAAGGNSDDCLMCPSRTWSGSRSRTIMY